MCTFRLFWGRVNRVWKVETPAASRAKSGHRANHLAIPPPHKKGISAILARYHMKTMHNRCNTLSIPFLRYDLENVLRDMGGYLALGRYVHKIYFWVLSFHTKKAPKCSPKFWAFILRLRKIPRGRVNREVQTMNWEADKEGGCRDRCREWPAKAPKPWIRSKKNCTSRKLGRG